MTHTGLVSKINMSVIFFIFHEPKYKTVLSVKLSPIYFFETFESSDLLKLVELNFPQFKKNSHFVDLSF